MSSPTTEKTNMISSSSLSLSDSMSLTADTSESPSPLLQDPTIDRIHFKVYRVIDKDKRKYVGRCWSIDSRTAALKLGTRGLPREDCTTLVLVENASLPELPAEQFRVRQFFGEMTPGSEAKYMEKGNLSPDGLMKYKEIAPFNNLTSAHKAAAAAIPPTRPLPKKSVNQSSFRITPSAPASAKPLTSSAPLIMVPVWAQMPATLGYCNPWSMPTQMPSVASATATAPSPVAQASKPVATRKPPQLRAQRPPSWSLNPVKKYNSAAPVSLVN